MLRLYLPAIYILQGFYMISAMLLTGIFFFQVTIHEDSMSIADSIFSMRVSGLPNNSGLNGRHSKQSSLSIHSASGNIRASPTIVTRGFNVPGLNLNQRNCVTNSSSQQNLPGGTNAGGKLPRQESSFTQEEIYRLDHLPFFYTLLFKMKFFT